MEQMTLRFYEDVFAKLNERAENKKMALAPYVRQLVELGLRIEEMSEKKETQESDSENLIKEALDAHEKLLVKDLAATYEMAYLMRYIVAKLPEKNKGENDKMLEGARIKSKTILEVILEEKKDK